MARWDKPVYRLKASKGKYVEIDVTTSVSAGLKANKVVTDVVIPLFRDRGVRSVLDFGAGALRHAIPLLNAGFQVCAVEFEEAYDGGVAAKKRALAEKHANFSALVWPRDFIKDRRRFDAALIVYVLQTMPVEKERRAILKYVKKKLRGDAYMFYASRYGQITEDMKDRKVKDGYYMWPERKRHSFYTEFTTEKTHKMMAKYGFQSLRSLGRGGNEQLYLYTCGSGVWI